MNLPDWIQTIGILVAFGGIIVAIYYNRKQINILNDHLKIGFFADYTKRYQEIMLNLPDNISQQDFDFSDLNEVEKAKVFRYMRAYFDLCSEEYELWLSGYIEERIWLNWEQGIKNNLDKEAFSIAWEHVNFNSYYYPDFTKWINENFSNEKV